MVTTTSTAPGSPPSKEPSSKLHTDSSIASECPRVISTAGNPSRAARFGPFLELPREFGVPPRCEFPRDCGLEFPRDEPPGEDPFEWLPILPNPGGSGFLPLPPSFLPPRTDASKCARTSSLDLNTAPPCSVS